MFREVFILKLEKLIVLLVLLSLPIFSQSVKFNNNLFLEAFGNGGAYSLNYDRVIYNNISVRAGFSLIKSEDDLVKTFPIIMNYRLYLKNNYFEFGFGTTIFTLPLNFTEFENREVEGFLLTGVVSYCFQSPIGINGRMALTPFYFGNEFILFGGFSIGYSF